MLGRKNEYLQYIERGGLCWVESNIDANTVPVCICTNVEQIQDTYLLILGTKVIFAAWVLLYKIK